MRKLSNTTPAANKASGKANKPATDSKPVAPVTTEAATEAKPDPRAERAARVAAERKAVHAIYHGFEATRVSVPVKPLSAFKPATTTAHPIARNPSTRQAAAIVLAFAATSNTLADGGKAPRVFERDGVRYCIENGVLRDAVSSGLIRVSGSTPETETITIAPGKAAAIAGLIGEKLAKQAGYATAKAA